METENGSWIIKGKQIDDPERIKSPAELAELINTLGFLPFFSGDIEGFSAEENCSPLFWWTGDPETDPWEWREIIARSGEIAYGKYFGGKAGFISKEYFPLFANYRRDGYDFDSMYEDGKAKERCRKIMELFSDDRILFSHDIKATAGFGKGGEKNFSGIMTELQMQTFLIARDFRRKISKKGNPYGMTIAMYSTPEALWGYDYVTSAYSEDPSESFEKLAKRMQIICPKADMKAIRKFLK